MKANEAPKKLYLHPTAKNNVGASWLTFPLTDNDIEYTRTDAFIEDAVAFLKERIILKDNSWYVEGQVTLKDKMIEDFRNYMKGG